MLLFKYWIDYLWLKFNDHKILKDTKFYILQLFYILQFFILLILLFRNKFFFLRCIMLYKSENIENKIIDR